LTVVMCGYEHGSLTLRNIHRLWVVENIVGKNPCTRERGSTWGSREKCTVRNYMICTWWQILWDLWGQGCSE